MPRLRRMVVPRPGRDRYPPDRVEPTVQEGVEQYCVTPREYARTTRLN